MPELIGQERLKLGAMHLVARVANPGVETTRINVAQEPTAGVAMNHSLDRPTDRGELVSQPDLAESANCKSSERKAGVYLRELLSSFEHGHVKPRTSQLQGSREPADAATDDDRGFSCHPQPRPIRSAAPSPRRMIPRLAVGQPTHDREGGLGSGPVLAQQLGAPTTQHGPKHQCDHDRIV